MKATSDFTEITVFGARGHSLMILRGLEEYWRGRVRIRALIDDLDNGFVHPVLGVPVISSDQRAQAYADLPVLLSVTHPGLRQRVAARLEAEGATLATAICPGRINLDPSARFGPGAVSMPWTRIGPDVEVGACAILLASIIAHDVQIGAFSTLAGDALVSGHVRIGAGVNIAPRAARRDRQWQSQALADHRRRGRDRRGRGSAERCGAGGPVDRQSGAADPRLGQAAPSGARFRRVSKAST